MHIDCIAKKHPERLTSSQIQKLADKELIVKNGEEWIVVGDIPSTNPSTNLVISMRVKRLLDLMDNGEYSSFKRSFLAGIISQHILSAFRMAF